MDGETPSWLEGTTSAAAPTPAPPAPEPASEPETFDLNEPAPSSEKTARAQTTDNVAGTILGSMNATADAPKKEVDESDLPKMIFVMRVLNLAAAGLLIGVSIAQLVQFFQDISVWIMSLYATFGGILVCCLETQLKFIRTSIAMNFGFLFNPIYRFVFYALMATVCWGYDRNKAFGLGKITAIVLGVTAVFNTYVICRYPSYRRAREKIAEEEDKRLQAKINKQVRKQAFSQMGWGGSS